VAISADGKLNAQKLTGNYAGETELKDGTDFYLLNKTGAKIMGSLHGDRAVGMAANSILTQARVDSNTKDPANEELVTLTGTDPLHTADKTLKARVQLTYTGETYDNAALGDILLNLKNVPAADAAKRVSADNLGSDFKNDMMATAKPDTKTIVLAEGTVRVVWGFIQQDGAYRLGYFETSVASALQSIAKEEKTRKEKGEIGYGYVISMFEEGYILNNNDFNAMSSIELADVAQIDWVSFIGMEETNVGGKKERKVKINDNPATVVPSDDWVFYGKANRLGKIKLKYDQPKALYANGSVLTTLGNLEIDAKDDNALPAVYGGGTKDVNVGDTRLILRGGRFSKVYGGGYGKTGSTYVELASPQLEVPEVYGGGLSETKDTTVVAKAGKINGIYGGGNGKDAVVQGNTHVQIETTYGMDQLNISKASIYGGGKDGSRVSAGKTRKITIASQETVPEAGTYYRKSEVNNIEDFDLLEIGNTTKPNLREYLTVTGRIISDSKGNQYTGDVALHHSKIFFKGAESSHIRNLTKDGDGNLISIMKNANQTYPLLLDGTFTSDPQDSKLTLTHNGTAADGDVMLEFREQANAREEQYDTDLLGVSVEKNLAEKKENQIILKAYSVLVGKRVNNGGYNITELTPEGLVYTHYTSVAKALNKVGQYAKDAEVGKTEEEIKNGAAGTYFISIYRENYEFTKQDYEAMLKTAEPGNDAEDPLSYVKDTTLEWCSNYGTYVTADGKRYGSRNDLTPRTVRISGDLNFAGQNVTVRGLKLRYLNERNIFANGMPLTINYDVEIAKEDNAANYPTIYGGGNWPVGSTNLTVMSGNYRYIYGGGASEKGRVTGDTKLLLSDKPVSVIAGNSLVGTAQKQSQITADGVFGGGKGYVNGNTEVSVYTGTYGWLYGGGFGGNGTVKGNTEVMIYGNANQQVSVTDTLAGGGRSQAFTEGQSAIRVWYAQNTALNPIPVNLTVKDVSDFDVLQVGNVNASNTISKMTVSGKLRGRYDSTAKETGGALVFRNGQVSFTGPYNPTVKDLNTAGANSQMIIYKDTKTYPMMAKGTMTLYKEKAIDPEYPLGLNVSQNAAERDILLDFKEEPNAQDGQYKWLGVSTLNVFKDNNQIILDRNGRFFMRSAKINTIVDSIMSPYNANTLFWQTKKKASDSKGSWTELTKGEEHAGIKGINNDPEVILEARQDKFGGGADWWNNFTNANYIEDTRNAAHSLLVDGKNKTYYAYENSAWNHKSSTGVSMQIELRNCTLPITSRFHEGNGDLYMNIQVSPNGYLKLNNIRMQDTNLSAGGHWYSLYVNQGPECSGKDENTTIELVSGLPSEKNWITPAYATGGASHQIIRASESDFVSPIRVDSAKKDMYVSTNGDHKLWFTWLSASSGDNLRFGPSPYLKLNGVRRTVQRKDGSEIAVEDIKNLTEEEKKEFYVDVDQLDLNEVGTVVIANESQIWMDPATFKSKIHQQVIELESDINILKSTRDFNIGAFYITKAYISNGYTMRLGANNLQTQSRHDGVGYAAPRMRLDGEVAGRATFPLDPNLFDVVEEQKYEYDNNRNRTAIWEIVNSDTDLNTIVFRRRTTKPHPIWLYYDHDDSDTYKIGEYDSYEDALEKVKEEVEKGKSNTYFLKAVVPTTFTELDRDALKTLDLGDKAKQIHLTFTGSSFTTGHGKVLYGDRYHITSKVSRIEMPAGVSVTWNQAVAFEQQSLEVDGLENPVFVGNGGALIFD